MRTVRQRSATNLHEQSSADTAIGSGTSDNGVGNGEVEEWRHQRNNGKSSGLDGHSERSVNTGSNSVSNKPNPIIKTAPRPPVVHPLVHPGDLPLPPAPSNLSSTPEVAPTPVPAKYLCGMDGTPLTSATFDMGIYIKDHIPDIRLLDSPAGRIALTRADPLLFALVYCPNALKAEETGGVISFSDLHLELCRIARTWMHPTPAKSSRVAVVSPRESGKSTWVFKLLPLWAAAHGHVTFIAAFADSATQAEDHLLGLRAELESNGLLRQDYPGLCRPQRRGGNVQADSRREYYAASGFVMKARGMESSVLGMKVGDRRPGLLIVDDAEPGEAGYSPSQAEARLVTLQDTILPLHPSAPVVLTGTVNMEGSILDQLVTSLSETPAPWIVSTGFRVKYFPALVTLDDGTERSIWPQKWSIPWLLEEQRTDPRGFAKSYMNAPIAIDGVYWDRQYFQYGKVDPCSFTVLSIDPAVTSKSASDFTGMAVVGYSKSQDQFVVRYAAQFKMPSNALRSKTIALLNQYPEITAVIIETNMGADLWTDPGGAFYDLPNVKVLTIHQTESKELRAERTVLEYTKGRVFHEQPLPALERQMLSFPQVVHDDQVDALTTGINEIRKSVKVDLRNRQHRGIVMGRNRYAG